MDLTKMYLLIATSLVGLGIVARRPRLVLIDEIVDPAPLALWAQIALTLVAALIAMMGHSLGESIGLAVFACSFAYLAAWDARFRVVPLAPIIILIGFGLGFTLWRLGVDGVFTHALAGAAGFVSFYLINRVYWLWRGRDGLGGGDGWLAMMIGVWFSFSGLIWAVTLGAAGSVLWVLRRPSDEPIALAPGLFVGVCAYVVMQRLGWGA